MTGERGWVAGALSITHGHPAATGGEPVDAVVAVTTNRQLLIRLETGTVWVLELEPAQAAYIAGRLAVAAGVTFDGGAG